MKDHKLKDLTILEKGFKILQIEGQEKLLKLANNKDWKSLDETFFELIKKGALIHNLLKEHHDFDHIEHLINLREAENDEDGIWHDDGSRLLAFSLSLNSNVKLIKGGELLIRRKEDPNQVISLGPFPFGTLTIFLTGHYGYEHKVCKVQKGERLSIAGWCS